MSEKDISALLEHNKHNAPGMFRVVINALAQKHPAAVYKKLDEMANAEPNNAIVLQTFCLAWNAVQMMFPPDLIDSCDALGLPCNPDDPANMLYHSRLNRAYRLDQKPWIGLITDGLRQADSEHKGKSGVKILERAVDIASEIAYTHYALAYVLCGYKQGYTSYPRAKSEAELAFKFHPFFWSDAMLLFDINSYYLPSHNEALKWRNIVLSFTPDHSVLDPITHHDLESYK